MDEIEGIRRIFKFTREGVLFHKNGAHRSDRGTNARPNPIRSISPNIFVAPEFSFRHSPADGYATEKCLY
jgi:hypothetical protein